MDTNTGSHQLGYARVSTKRQDPQLQVDALTAAGCHRVWHDRASGRQADRPELAQVLDHLRPGDVLVVWKLDRLGRSLRHLIEVIQDLDARGVGFRSLTEGIDTTTPMGKLVLHILGAIAEFESDLIKERVNAGLEAARDKNDGKNPGGRPTVMTAAKLDAARRLVDVGEHTLTEVAASIGVSRATLHRHLDRL